MLQVIKVSKIKEKKQVCWAFYFECCSMNANLIQGMLWILRAARGSRGKRTSGARWAISGHHTHSHTLTEVAKITLAFPLAACCSSDPTLFTVAATLGHCQPAPVCNSIDTTSQTARFLSKFDSN